MIWHLQGQSRMVVRPEALMTRQESGRSQMGARARPSSFRLLVLGGWNPQPVASVRRVLGFGLGGGALAG